MRKFGAATIALAALAVSGCAPRVHLPDGSIAPERTIVLNDHTLTLHFANAHARTSLPLLVYATGDGGWHRKDLDLFHHLILMGYPIVGFDAHDYVTHLGNRTETTPTRLGADYGRIITMARDALHLALNRPVVLVGVSRGAGLSVVAAGQRALRPAVSGVLAVALTREEEYVTRRRRLRRGQRTPPGREMVETYEVLPLLGMPVAVIQSTHDNYLPAAEARELFGPDTPRRRFEPIESRNHSFSDARDRLYAEMEASLEWIDERLSLSAQRD
jgi:Bacterial virulence protein (VirJ)